MTLSTFADLGVAEPLLRVLTAEGYAAPTPVQIRAIPLLLAGKDVLAVAQTGTGKTAAFALPLLQQLADNTERPGPKQARALILAPTRELVMQITDSFAVYGRNLKLKRTAIVGGVSQGPQCRSMAGGVDVLVATPGRLLDLIGQGQVSLAAVRHLVLDEADRMLDMGFIRDVRAIIAALPKRRQSLLFSATMPASVAKLAADLLTDPVRIEVTPDQVTVEKIDQRVIHVAAADKARVLTGILADPALARVIVFTRTKHHANRVAEHLDRAGISADALHGNKSQNARQRALDRFKAGQARVLVATDIAARGIDVDDVTHVINFEIPNEPESYVHRIGRTARAGASGSAVSLCDATETDHLRRIERLTGRRIDVVGAPKLAPSPPPAARPATPAQAPRPAAPRKMESRKAEPAERNGTPRRRNRSRRRGPAAAA